MKPLNHLWLRTTAGLSEQLTDNSVVSELWAHSHLTKAALPLQSDAKRLNALLKACRRLSVPPSRRWLNAQLKSFVVGPKSDVARRNRVGWERYYNIGYGQLRKRTPINQSLVVKAPGPSGEKGVLYISFEYNWMKLVANYDAAAILKDYYIVGQTSWSPTDYASLIAFAGFSSDPLFIGVSNLGDVEPLGILRPVIEPLPILASDWNDPDHFKPKPYRERTIDIVMVANWSRAKRHWLLFEALRHMPRNLRVVLIGRNAPDGTEETILAQAQAFGVPQDIELRTNLESHEVSEYLCDARISTIFTKREGSCVAVTESMFAGAPVAIIEEGHIGSKAYINDQTGVLVRRRSLARQLQQFLEESERYRPREWAMENISCLKTSERVNDALRQWAIRAGRPWTTDIVPLCWKYVPQYLHAVDKLRLAPAVQELGRKYGLALEEFPGERAAARDKAQQQQAITGAAASATATVDPLSSVSG